MDETHSDQSNSCIPGIVVEEANRDDNPPSSSLQPSSDNLESELDNFRQQWHKELKASPQHGDVKPINLNRGGDAEDQEEILNEAKTNFLRGVHEERKGNLYEAISFYRRAVQLVPDIEFQLASNQQDFSEHNSSVGDDSGGENQDIGDSLSENDEDEDPCDIEIVDLLAHVEEMLGKSGAYRVCKPARKQMMTHFSQIPNEVFNYILKWVVSNDLDCHSLEQVSKVCRGFYIGAREDGIWRLACLRVWGASLSLSNKYRSWRNMFIYRPHVWFHGAYISKTTYIRYGESSFQDCNYRPCYIVEYYRYLRFFPEGIVLMLTTPDPPYQSLAKLRQRKSRHQTVLSGHYRLVGTSIIAVLNRPKMQSMDNQSSSAMGPYSRARRQRLRNIPGNEPEESFNIELDIHPVRQKPNFKLSWMHYSLHRTFRNGEETVSNIDMTPTSFPPFWFSRVRSFNIDSETLLQ